MSGDEEPNYTLYVQNLNEKLNVDELKRNLYMLFSTHGALLDIKARRTQRLRGQAWVSFDDVASATRAKQELDGFVFLGKPLRISYARAKGDAVRMLLGDPPRERRSAEAQRRMVLEQQAKNERKAASKPSSSSSRAPMDEEGGEDDETVDEVPFHVLFVERIPDGMTAPMLEKLFGAYEGFVEVRLVTVPRRVAFAEFRDIRTAMSARVALDGFKVSPTAQLKVTFGKSG